MGKTALWVLWGLLTVLTSQAASPSPDPALAPTNGPQLSLARFREIAPQWGEGQPVRVSGTVTLSLANNAFFIEEDGVGVYVHHFPPIPFPLGTRLELAAFPALTGLEPTLRACTVLQQTPGPEPSPYTAAPGMLFDRRFHMRLVRITARLGPERPPGAGLWNLSIDESRALVADWNAVQDREKYFAIRPGSLVEVTGVCTVRAKAGDPLDRVHIHLRSPNDVRVLAPPPWWTPRRILTALGGAVAALCLALFWGWSLRGVVRRRTAELRQELARAEALELRFATIFRACPEAMVIVRTQDERILDVNPAFERLFGIPRAEVIRQTTAELGLWIDPTERDAAIERIKRDKSIANLERRLRSRTRGEIVVLASAEMIEFGGEPCMLSLLRDITERRLAEQERQAFELKLQQTQKLESLGLLAGGIAHDFNNILTVVLGNLSLAQADPHLPEETHGALIDANHAALRAADLARQMLAYSGKGTFRLQRVRLDELVDEIRRMLQVSVSKNVLLRSRFAADTPEVEVDATQLRQVVLNLVINASDAIGDQPGTVELSTGAQHCDRAYLASAWIDDSLPEGQYAFLEVRDTGCGIPSENLGRIFDPFFTTKFTGRGLGLAAVLGIVRSHRGALRVSSTVGQGTTFRVLLPQAGHNKEEPLAVTSSAQPWRGRGTVLFADDEPDNRKVGATMLAHLGFQTITAVDGLDCLEVLQRVNEPPCCVILDLTMPRMGGLEAFREIRRLRPGLAVVLCSGYSEHDVIQRCADAPPDGFIAKPYTLETLRTTLRTVLSPATLSRT